MPFYILPTAVDRTNLYGAPSIVILLVQ